MNRSLRLHFRLAWPTGLLLGLCCALLVGAADRAGWLNAVQRGALDALFQARGARSPDPRITILVADDATVAQVGHWPLPRRLYADVVRRLDRAGARTIAFDILFSVPSYSAGTHAAAADDADLARACSASGRVVQAAVFHVPLVYNPALPSSLTSDKRTPPARFAVTDHGARCRSATWVSSALPELQDSAPALGHVNVFPEADGTLRRIPLIRYRGRIYPSLALAAATHFLHLSPHDVSAERDALRLNPPADGPDRAPRTVPLDDNGEAWVNWAGGNDTFPTYNFNQLLTGKVPAVALRDRVVLVGITAAGAFELRSTPFSPVQPAVELQASALSDILSNRPLHELPLVAQAALLLLAALVAGLLVTPHRALGSLLWLLALEAVLWRGAVWLLGQHDIYVPVAAPMLAGLLTHAVATVLNYRQEWEANWRVDAAVTALARGGALMASGREREALMAVIRRCAREVLQARDVRVILQATPLQEAAAQETIPTGTTEVCAAPASVGRTRLPTLAAVAQRIMEAGQVVLWSARASSRVHHRERRLDTPARRRRPARAGSSPVPTTVLAPLDPLTEHLLGQLNGEINAAHQRLGTKPDHAFHTLLAAPLPTGPDALQKTGDRASRQRGILLAAGRRDGRAFSRRDAILLETLAEQAALALDNLEYYEVLRGRVDLANRDLRQAYQALAEERAKLAATIESSESALIITDEAARAVFINAASAGILLRATPRPGQNVAALLESQGLPEFARLFDEVRAQSATPRASAETTRLVQRSPQHPEARSVLTAQLTSLTSSDGRHLGAMLVVTDVTAQRELEQMKDDFVSYVAHELRSPLTAINGYAFLLRSGSARSRAAQREEMIAAIEAQCGRLDRMVSDLLEVSRLEPGREMQLERAEIDLVALCEHVLQDQRAAVAGLGLFSLEMHCDRQALLMEADAERLEQVLINLFSNAIKYSPDGGRVTLTLYESAESASEEVVLRVTDTGIGMTRQQLAQLFQKYYRTPEARARGIQGTGLGLHLVKHIVEAHGGRIEVSSEPGCGTSFTITLPKTAPGLARSDD